MANTNLHSARKAKNDEFYTQLSDIEAEFGRYWSSIGTANEVNPFRDKVVFLNCDDPAESNFWVYFAKNFDFLGIKELIATHYTGNKGGGVSYAMHLDRDEDTGVMNDWGTGNKGVPLGRCEDLAGDGDFRSEECLALLERADVVVTNPPFSLFREYVQTLVEYQKKFLIIGSKNAITYKEIFPLIKNDEMWIGYRNMAGGMWFAVPAGEKFDKVVNDVELRNVPSCWFTNMDHAKRHEKLILTQSYRENPDQYPRYDNYDAIEVSKVVQIPKDWDGVMGVPITFLDKHNPEQFEIVGTTNSNEKDNACRIRWYTGAEKAQAYQDHFGRKGSYDLNAAGVVNGVKCYGRILIKRKV